MLFSVLSQHCCLQIVTCRLMRCHSFAPLAVPYLPWEPLLCQGGSSSSVLNPWLAFPTALNLLRGRQNFSECLENWWNVLALLLWNTPITPRSGWMLIQPRCSTWNEMSNLLEKGHQFSHLPGFFSPFERAHKDCKLNQQHFFSRTSLPSFSDNLFSLRTWRYP